MKRARLPLSAFAAAVAVTFGATPAVLAETFITIGTGGVTGVYYPTGGNICEMVNENNEDISCTAESTGGSIYNINTIRAGELDFGVAQSDWQYHAYNGTSKFTDKGPFKNLRAVFSVHPEPFTVVARADAGITTFEDLKGKRVNIGNPGSGQRATMELVMEKMGWTMDDFKAVSELKSSEQSKALCDNNFDAMVFTVGHPSGSISEVTTTCDTVLVEVSGPEVEALANDNDYYRLAEILVNKNYPNAKNKGETVGTFGVGATFVSSTDVPNDVVYKVVKAVFENFEEFKELHPAFAVLEKKQMVKDGLSAPLHCGAKKYYVDQGLIEGEKCPDYL